MIHRLLKMGLLQQNVQEVECSVTCLTLFAIVMLSVVSAPAMQKERVKGEDGLTYVWIPPGAYWTGCLDGDKNCIGDERKSARITINAGFWIAQTEVTQSAYDMVMHAAPSYYNGSHLPVERVSWSDAETYCHRIGMRLPTESEWEYAAYGGTAHLPRESLAVIAWYDPNSGDRTHPVREKLPNEFGLYDMLGNVWEWVDDVGTAPEGRVLKGASFYNSARDLRVADRLGAPADLRHRDVGFRCAANQW